MKKILVLQILLLVLLMLAFPLLAIAGEAPTLQACVDGLAQPAAVVTEPATRPPIDVTSFLEAIIGLATALITAYVVPWLRQHNLEQYAKVAVYAAEKLIGPKMGPDKLKKALEFMQLRGYNIDAAKVQAAIEAAVQQLSLEQAAALSAENPPADQQPSTARLTV